MLSVEDARSVLLITARADGGCPVCVNALFREVVRTWPELDWKEVALAFPEKYGEGLVHYDEANTRESFLEFLEE